MLLGNVCQVGNQLNIAEPVSFSLPEAARLLGVTTQAIEKQIKREELRLVGESRRVQAAEVVAAVHLRHRDLTTDLEVLRLEARRFGIALEPPNGDSRAEPYAQAVLRRLAFLESQNVQLGADLEAERTGRAVAEAKIDELRDRLDRTRRALRAFEVEPDPRSGLTPDDD